MSESVLELVTEMAGQGISRFRASYVARELHERADDVHAELAGLAERGDLDTHFEVICPDPDCHRTAATYESEGDIPLDAEVVCLSGHHSTVSLRNVWVYFTPSRELLLRVARDRAKPKKKSIRPSLNARLKRTCSRLLRKSGERRTAM